MAHRAIVEPAHHLALVVIADLAAGAGRVHGFDLGDQRAIGPTARGLR
jgi:hypothetical protein